MSKIKNNETDYMREIDPALSEEIMGILLDTLLPPLDEEDEYIQALLKEHEEWEKQQAKAAKKKKSGTTGRKKRTKKDKSAEQFLDCIPPEMKEILSDEQLKYQQYELSVGIAEALKSKLSWALNQAWLDAKSNNSRS